MRSKEFLVVFGKKGAGKDTVCFELARQFDYTIYHANRRDTNHPGFLASLITSLSNWSGNEPLAINFAFSKKSAQAIFRKAFPHARWLYIERNLAQDTFDTPDFPHDTIVNNGDIPTLSQSITNYIKT